MIFLDKQLCFLYFLQALRSPSVDFFFYLLNFLDTSYFTALLLAFIWIGYSWRWGARIAYLLATSNLLNFSAKHFFQLPRPFHLDDSLAIVHVQGFGFPSGGAQNAFLLGGLLIYYWKSPWAWPLGLFYIVLVSFSRMFLGVHFPVDILGGWILGLVLLLLFITLMPKIEKVVQKAPLKSFILAFVVPLFLSIFLPKLRSLSSLLALPTGIYLSSRFHLYLFPPKKISHNLLLGLFAVASTFIIGFILEVFFYPYVAYFLLTLWINLVLSPLCKKLFRV